MNRGSLLGAIIVLFVVTQAGMIYLARRGWHEMQNQRVLGSILRPERIEIKGPVSYENAAEQSADCFCVTEVKQVAK